MIFFLQFYRLSAICTENNKEEKDTLITNKADALASLNLASTQLDKFVLLSYAQTELIKRENKKNEKKSDKSKTERQKVQKQNSKSSSNIVGSREEQDPLLVINPIIIRSHLSRTHSYAVVLTPNYNLNATCCNCDCHPKSA
jgi:hypothetical protein